MVVDNGALLFSPIKRVSAQISQSGKRKRLKQTLADRREGEENKEEMKKNNGCPI